MTQTDNATSTHLMTTGIPCSIAATVETILPGTPHVMVLLLMSYIIVTGCNTDLTSRERLVEAVLHIDQSLLMMLVLLR